METITIRSVWVKFYSAWRILICVEKKKKKMKPNMLCMKMLSLWFQYYLTPFLILQILLEFTVNQNCPLTLRDNFFWNSNLNFIPDYRKTSIHIWRGLNASSPKLRLSTSNPKKPVSAVSRHWDNPPDGSRWQRPLHIMDLHKRYNDTRSN